MTTERLRNAKRWRPIHAVTMTSENADDFSEASLVIKIS